MKIDIVPVWKQVTPELATELLSMWRDNRVTVEEARAAQAVCVLRDEAGALCGVVTAVIKVLPRLRQPMYYYRMFFTRALRGHQQFLPAFTCARQVLQDYNAKLETPESLGLLLELENDKLGKAYPHAHEPAFDATFIGYSPRGLQLRVSYFDNAVLLPPVPVRGPAVAASQDGRFASTRRVQPNTRHGNDRA